MVYETFLEKTAKFILEKTEGNPVNSIVVFPNKRPIVFLKKLLTDIAGKTIWLPDMMSIDDFMSKISQTEYEDPLKIYFKLYDIHKNIAGEKAKSPDDFLNWAPVILHDFEDIDFSLVHPSEIFSYLTDARALEQWNTDGKPLTDMQISYLSFFRSLEQYYNELKKILAANNSGYRAMVYRNVAENIDSLIKNFHWNSLFFAGFNALSKAEQKVVEYLNKSDYDFHYIVDADRFYLNNPKQRQKEAGKFINEHILSLKLKPPFQAENLLTSSPKLLETVAVPLSVGQTLYAAQKVEKWLNDGINPLDIAIILGDENLLIPLLDALPRKREDTGEKISYNVTLGYPLSNSPYQYFANKWLELLNTKQNEPSGKFFVPLINSLLNCSLIKRMAGDAGIKAKKIFAEQNMVMITGPKLTEILENTGLGNLAEIIFTGINSPSQFVSRFLKLLEIFKTDSDNDGDSNLLFAHQTQMLQRQIVYLKSIVEQYENDISWKTLQKTVQRLFSGTKVNLRGEPLNGVQIMGLLETRSLDFKNVIFLGLNEGIIPASSFSDTLIPFDIKQKFELPLPHHSTAVYAYHFFRLLQRSGKAVFLYNSQPGNLGGGEKSRFILQIEDELLPLNNKIQYKVYYAESPVKNIDNNENIEITKEGKVIEQLNAIAQSGYSASALNTYLLCPLKFYFKYILKLKEPQTAEISVEANTFGKVVHGVLQQLYEPFTGKTIDIDILKKNAENIDKHLKENFEIHYKTSDLSYGRNALIYSVAKEYITRFLKYDTGKLKNEPRKIVALEKKYEYTLKIKGNNVRLKGFFDRVDTNNNDIRIIDYKTGQVSHNDLIIKDCQTFLTGNKKHDKAFQILLYAWLFKRNNPGTVNLRPGIISLRNISNGFAQLSNKDKNMDELIDGFEDVLKNIIEEITGRHLTFTQTTEKDNCKYCEFKTICNR